MNETRRLIAGIAGAACVGAGIGWIIGFHAHHGWPLWLLPSLILWLVGVVLFGLAWREPPAEATDPPDPLHADAAPGPLTEETPDAAPGPEVGDG
jgi:uncharacterized membrane protein YfcA